MLNIKIAVLYLCLGMGCSGIMAQDQTARVIGLKEALAMAADRIGDTISGAYAADIKSEYYRCIYGYNRLSVLDEKMAVYGKLMEIAGLHYKLGETDIEGSELPHVDYLEAESQYTEAVYDLRISENNLRKLLFTGDSVIPDVGSPFKYLQAVQAAEISAADGSGGDYNQFLKQKELMQMDLMLEKHESRFSCYEKILGLSQSLVEAAGNRYENEDIEYCDYAGIACRALDLKLEYLKILNEYNQAAIRMELYMKKNLNDEKY
jgi:hypothetical protein